MKKRNLLIAFAAAAVIVTGVFIFYMRSDHNDEKTADTYGYFDSIWCTGKGAFSFENGYVDYYSPTSGKKVLICNKSGCDHSDGCPAAFDASVVTGITFNEQGLLYLSDEGCSRFDEKILYQADVDGTNRRKLHTFSSLQMISNVRYFGKYMFICYRCLLDEEGHDLDEPEAGIIVYDLENHKDRILFKECKINADIENCFLYQDKVYFSYLYSDLDRNEVLKHAEDEAYMQEHYISEVCSIPLNVGKKKRLIDGISYMAYLPVINGKIIYSTKDAVIAYDLEKEEKKKLIKEACDVIPVYPENERVILRPGNRENVDGKKTYYDLNVKKMSFQEVQCGNFVILAVVDDIVYYMDREGNYGYCTKKDFLTGKATEFHGFEDVIQRQLGK